MSSVHSTPLTQSTGAGNQMANQLVTMFALCMNVLLRVILGGGLGFLPFL